MVQPNARAFLVSRDRIVDMSASIVDDRTPNDNDRGGDEDVPDTVEEDVAAIRRAYEQMDQHRRVIVARRAARVGGGDDDDGDNSDGSPTHARGPPGAPDETERLRRSILLHEISLLTTELERLNLGAEKLEKPADFELVDRWVKESDAMTAAYEDVLLPALQRDLELVEAEGFILDKELAALTELRRALESEVQEIRNGVWEVNERKRITRQMAVAKVRVEQQHEALSHSLDAFISAHCQSPEERDGIRLVVNALVENPGLFVSIKSKDNPFVEGIIETLINFGVVEEGNGGYRVVP